MSQDLNKDLTANAMREMSLDELDRVANSLEEEWRNSWEKQDYLPPNPGGTKRGMTLPTDLPSGMMSRMMSLANVEKNGSAKNGRKAEVLRNDFADYYMGLHTMRVSWLQSVIDPRRNFEQECGYPTAITPKQYRFMYDRIGTARRVNDIYPDECWAVDPDVYEQDDAQETLGEIAWNEMQMVPEVCPLHYLHKLDVLCGIGRYGTMLFGLDDELDLAAPAPGLDERGQEDVASRKGKDFKIQFLRPFDEIMSQIINYEKDPTNPRFGMPVYYHVLFADVRVGEPGVASTALNVTSKVVHWTRLQHCADNTESNNVFGIPRMQDVFNNLCDIRKVLGGSAEMFWKGGFPGYSLEMNPELLLGGVPGVDHASIKRQMDDYSNGLSRYLAFVGLQAKSLAPQVADCEKNLAAQWQAIALAKGIPLRIFMGSEQAQLASGQDVRTWNRRLMRRHDRFISPLMLRPFLRRCYAFGALPIPSNLYKIKWPDINTPSEDDKSKIADRFGAALMKYVMGGGYQVIPPQEFLTMIMGLTSDQVAVIKKAAGSDWDEIEPPNKGDNAGGGPGQGNTSGAD